jgi:Ca-activated chloride channel family protein
MTAAYKYADKERPLNVILLSDGLTEQQERAGLMQLIASRPAQSRVFCIGVGNDVNRGLLEQLANDSGGLAAFVSREDNFERQAAGFRRKLMRPVASDIALDFGNAQVYDVEPRKLPNLYHGMPVRLYGRYRGAGPVKLTLASNVSGKAVKQAVDLDFPQEDPANPEIERMWAWKRVDRLMNGADAGGTQTNVLDEIIFLGQRYSIATQYTSFIVLENDAEYRRWQIDRRNLLRLSRDRAAQTQLASKLEAMRNKAASELGPMTEQDKAAPTSTSPQTPASTDAASTPANVPSQSLTPNRNRQDVNLPVGGGGGGAIDPLSAGAVLLFAGIGFVIHRRGKKQAA